eukprot:gene12787-12915_t
MKVLPPGTWGTWASLFFFLAALCGGDLLALRCVMLRIASVPLVDMICWSLVSGVLHAFAVWRMLLDEVPVKFATDDDAQLARFFNRRSGMERLEAHEVLKRGTWVRVAAGQRILTSAQVYEGAYLLVEGRCRFTNDCCPSSTSGSLYSLSPASAPPGLHTAGACGSNHPPHQQDTSMQQPFTLTRVISLPDALPDPATIPPSVGMTSLVPATPKAMPGSPVRAAAVRAARTVAAATGMLKPKSAGSSPAQVPASPAASGDLEASCPSCAGNDPINKLHQLPSPAVHRLLPKQHRIFRSGNIFSLSALNVFGVYIGFDSYHGSFFEVWADTDCLLFSWPMSALDEMATSCSPSLAAYWRNFICYSVASEFEHQSHKYAARCSTGECESDSWLQGGRSRDFTEPVRPYEQPPPWYCWQQITSWFKKAVSPFPPPGLRHTALPLTGVMARTRAMAMAEARSQAERSREGSLNHLVSLQQVQQQQQQQPQAQPQ